MPDPTLSAAIREAYASAPADDVILLTIELAHPAFADTIRVVRDRVALDGRLEASAPRSAGEVVTFAPFAFEFVRPEMTSDGLPVCTLEMDNVARDIGAALDAAVMDGRPVEVIVREYLADDALDGPETDPPMRLTLMEVRMTPLRISATVGLPDLLNRAFPRGRYDLDVFAGLAP